MSFNFTNAKLGTLASDVLQAAHPETPEEYANLLRKPIQDEVANILIKTPEVLLPYSDVKSLYEITVGWTGRTPWQDFCWNRQDIRAARGDIHEFLNKEYVASLAKHIIDSSKALGLSAPVKILEIGAWNGSLSFYLSRELEALAWGGMFQVVATDCWRARIPALFEVEKLHHEEALALHRPDMALVSWMEPEAFGGSFDQPNSAPDMGYDIESTESVKQYYLIGTLKTCGMFGATWNPNIRKCDQTEFLEILDWEDRLSEEVILKHCPQYAGKLLRFWMRDLSEPREVQIWAQHDSANGFWYQYAGPGKKPTYLSRTVAFPRIR